MMYIPITPIIQAYYANAETSHLMRHRDYCLKQILDVLAVGAGVRSEFANSDNHIRHYRELGLFGDKRDTALSISSDGAQLTMKKQSNMWLLIVVLLNLPPEMCYRADNVIIPLAIPGPSAPGDIESFIYPLFEEMAQASVGMWTWDAVDSSYFVLRAYICGVKGDMLGSAKLSGMAGHSAKRGDRFSLVPGAYPAKDKGGKAQYYPISPPEKEKYNEERDVVDLNNLPLRDQKHYWETIERLGSAATKTERQNIVQETGISRLTMCAASPAFLHPSFFPLDPFHLFYENCMVHIWDLWVSHSKDDEQIHMEKDMASQLGEEIEKAVNTLPPSFSGPIRNPYKKRHSQYKIYEWMALLHWYIIPIAWELQFDEEVLENFRQFVDIVEVAMSHSPKSDDDLLALYNLAKSFLQGFERLYVGDDPAKVTRCRLCIWQLIHVPTHIAWNGSIRFGSQATVERAIGEIGHKVRSKKAPFANIATMLFERANNKVLNLHYPLIAIPPKEKRKRENLYQLLSIKKADIEGPSEYYNHLAAISDYLGVTMDLDLAIRRQGKCVIPGDITLRSRISEGAGQATRSSRYFEAQGEEGPIFGEALAFYFLPEHDLSLVVYHQLVKTFNVLGRWCGEWSKDCTVLEISSLTKLVGIWKWESRVHILRKHAGLDMLNDEEYQMEEQEG
jgi:Transposase family tnp2